MTTWKINFRCALNGLKDIIERRDLEEPDCRVYQMLPCSSTGREGGRRWRGRGRGEGGSKKEVEGREGQRREVEGREGQRREVEGRKSALYIVTKHECASSNVQLIFLLLHSPGRRRKRRRVFYPPDAAGYQGSEVRPRIDHGSPVTTPTYPLTPTTG